MKFFLSVLMVCFCFNLNAQGDPGKGHPQHFVAGFVIAGATSFLVYKKTDNKLKSWLIGAGSAVVIGLAKEAIDPLIGKERSFEDFAYTFLGGVVGASIIIPLKKSKPKKTTYLF